jgi:hypothetical protein
MRPRWVNDHAELIFIVTMLGMLLVAMLVALWIETRCAP